MTRSRYVKAPEPSPEVAPLYEAVLKILSGQLTVTAAAESVSLSRLRFQTRMHRGLSGLLEALEDQPRGRRATPELERALREEVEALRQENQQLRAQVNSTLRMMGLATEWMHKGLKSAGRQRGASPKKVTPSSESDDDSGAAARLEQVLELKADGVPAPLAAAAVGVSAPTARRWSARKESGQPLCRKRGPRFENKPPPAAAETAAIAILNDVRCHIGAAPLAKASGLSRREAASVKAKLVTQLELERREQTTKVSVLPGVLRGFDAVMLGKLPVLVSADGAVQYRTSITPAARYDSDAVAAAVAADFESCGAPLIWRVDRAKAHTEKKVLDVLRSHKVLVLHGPPHCPRYYGQLERQNREHRAWLGSARFEQGLDRLAEECEQMRRAFNELVPRRTLGWRTAASVWRNCAWPCVDRDELSNEVNERRCKLEEDEAIRSGHPGLAERLAIEAALINRGLLKLTKGGWC